MAKRLKATGSHVPLSPGVYPVTLNSIEELDSPKGGFRIWHFLVEVQGHQVGISMTTLLKRGPSAG